MLNAELDATPGAAASVVLVVVVLNWCRCGLFFCCWVVVCQRPRARLTVDSA